MSGSAKHSTPGSSGHRDGIEGLLTWEAASAMLPLAGRIAGDIVRHGKTLAHLLPEKLNLDSQRHALDWPARSRRYELEAEISKLETELRQFEVELESLGSVLLDPRSGLIGFPTIVNNQRAFFSWRPGEPSLAHWSYLGEQERHPVPASWAQQAWEIRPARRKRASR